LVSAVLAAAWKATVAEEAATVAVGFPLRRGRRRLWWRNQVVVVVPNQLAGSW